MAKKSNGSVEIEMSNEHHEHEHDVESRVLPMFTTVRIPETGSFRFNDAAVKELSSQYSKSFSLRDEGSHAIPNSSLDGTQQALPQINYKNSPTPVFLKFKDVKYKVHFKIPAKVAVSTENGGMGRYRQILNGIWGYVRPGEILAIMGPSGSGKTSLLRILGGRLQRGVSGTVTYNDILYSSALKRRIGFVAQDDLLFPQLTVEETLVFAALLRLPTNMTKNDKLMRAEMVLRELGLERCRNIRVGNPIVPGISGGERKRTSIGYELLVDPSLLLLDEPTSGLDSTTALKMLHVLQKSAKAGRTIVTTIHQPSSRLFHLFDRLIILSEGQPIYSGQARGAMRYFSSIGFYPDLPMNPADFLLDLASGNTDNISIPQELHKKPTRGLVEGEGEGGEGGDADGGGGGRGGEKVEGGDGQPRRSSVGDHHHGPSLAINEEENEHLKKITSLQFYHPRAAQDSEMKDDDDDDINEAFPDAMLNRLNLARTVIKYLRTEYKRNIESEEKRVLQNLSKAPDILQAAIQAKRNWSSSWVTQFMVLSKRTFKERARDYMDSLRLFQAICVGFLLGLLWWKSSIQSEPQLQDQVGLLFYICIFWSSSSLFSSVYSIPLESQFIAKERAADMYRISAYHASSTLCDMPSQLIYPTIFISIVYFMAGFQRTASAFLLTQLSVHLIVITGQGLGELFGASVPSIKKAGTIASLVLMIFLLTGGYYVHHIPEFISWLKYTSFIYYGFQLMLKVQYSPDQTYECWRQEGCRSIQTSPSFTNVNLNGGGQEALILLLMAVVYRLIAYIFLRRIKIIK